MTATRPLTSRDPARLGAHRLLGRLGEGGQGVVYLAEDESGTRVAVKLLHDRGGSRETFLKEVSAARKVASFCTAEILHVGQDDELPYVVTEFIDGPSLRALIEEKGPQNGPALYRLAIGTATALAAIHQAGIVHRDFKPGNVLVGPDGPRVIDFGVARSVDATATAASTVIGTPSYMAPEQFADEVVGPAADVFAWGATIAYAANGRPPHGQDTIPAVLNRIVKGKPDLGGLSGPLRDLVTRALHKDAAKRPASRDVLLHLLERSQGPTAAAEALAEGRALAMAGDDALTTRFATLRLPAELARRPTSRRRLILVGVAALAVLIAVTSALTVRSHLGIGPAPLTEPETGDAGAIATPETATPPASPSSTAVEAAVKQAMASRKTAAFSANGAIAQGDDSFIARGRLDYRSEQATNYDLTVRSRDGDGVTGVSAPARVFLIGRCIYLGGTPQHCRLEPGVDEKPDLDPHVWLAREVRWVSSPGNIFALLRHSTSLEGKADGKTVTYRGTTRLAPLAAGPAAPFYSQYSPDGTKLTFTLVTGLDHLPERLDIELAIELEPTSIVRSLYSVTYRSWGKGTRIDAPTLSP